jgi:hypothetical protein
VAAIDGLALGGGLEVAMVVFFLTSPKSFQLRGVSLYMKIVECCIRHAMHVFRLPLLN